jgi:hypothetical protein
MIYIIYTVLCIACLCVGFFVGYKINKPKEVKPIKIEQVKKRRENKEAEEEFKKYVDKYTTLLDNINNYDGTSNKQREVK